LDGAIREKGWVDTVCVHGCHFDLSLNDLVSRDIYVNGSFDWMNTEAMRRLMAPGDAIFDVGANIGYYTVLFSSFVGAEGKVHAFEPVPDTARRLRTNLAKNLPATENVRVHGIALSDRSGSVPMNVAGASNTGASHVTTPVPSRERGRAEAGVECNISVPCRRGDDVWTEFGCPDAALMKIDVEGHELHALAGMERMLQTLDRLVIFCEVNDEFLRAASASCQELFAFLASLGYRSFDYDHRTAAFVQNDAPRDGELIIFSKRDLSWSH